MTLVKNDVTIISIINNVEKLNMCKGICTDLQLLQLTERTVSCMCTNDAVINRC